MKQYQNWLAQYLICRRDGDHAMAAELAESHLTGKAHGEVSNSMKRIAIVLYLSLAACGDVEEMKPPYKSPEERVISEPAHGLGVIFGKPDPNYVPPGTPVDSPLNWQSQRIAGKR